MTKEHAAQAQARCYTARRFGSTDGLPEEIRIMIEEDLPAALADRKVLIEAIQPLIESTGLDGLVECKETVSMLLEAMGEH